MQEPTSSEKAPLIGAPATGVPVKTPREFKGRWFHVLGDFGAADVSATCLAWNAPWVAYGWNQQRAHGLTWWKEALKLLVLTCGVFALLRLLLVVLVATQCPDLPGGPLMMRDGPPHHHHHHFSWHMVVEDGPRRPVQDDDVEDIDFDALPDTTTTVDVATSMDDTTTTTTTSIDASAAAAATAATVTGAATTEDAAAADVLAKEDPMAGPKPHPRHEDDDHHHDDKHRHDDDDDRRPHPHGDDHDDEHRPRPHPHHHHRKDGGSWPKPHARAAAGSAEPHPEDAQERQEDHDEDQEQEEEEEFDEDDDDFPHMSAEEEEALHRCAVRVGPWAVLLMAVGISAFGYAVYLAAVRRRMLRERFGIEGSFKHDVLLWLGCAPCALAQETRTLMFNNVEEGLWHGPLSGPRQVQPMTA